jgi:hypothetical protein
MANGFSIESAAAWAPWAVAILLAVTAIAGAALAASLRGAVARHRTHRRLRRARAAEDRAAVLLERLGYDILGAEVGGSYDVHVDGRPVRIDLRADYVVERSGKRFVAEVKSGAAAPSIGTSATRRQLLEYRVAFDVDGVLLVDGETERAHAVEFPGAEPLARSRGSAALFVLAALAVGFGVGFVLGRI